MEAQRGCEVYDQRRKLEKVKQKTISQTTGVTGDVEIAGVPSLNQQCCLNQFLLGDKLHVVPGLARPWVVTGQAEVNTAQGPEGLGSHGVTPTDHRLQDFSP